MKEKFCEKYFENNVKPKHLKEFCEKTPDGNVIKGYICRKANKHLGSLVITHITEKSGRSYDTEQFVQSFPKINYWDEKYRLKEDGESVIYYCTEKFDGICLILYSLNDDYGNSIEIIPKTRTKAVADERILEMYDLIDKKAIEKYFSNSYHLKDSLMFELYGILNKHEIAYMETYINIRLIGAYVDEIFLDFIAINCNGDLNDFSKPDNIFSIEKHVGDSSFAIHWQSHSNRLRNYQVSTHNTFPTLYGAIVEVKELLKSINDDYLKNNGRRAIEGVVINGQHFKYGQIYLKIKPRDVEMELNLLTTIPRRFILKEIQKYFDEYGSKVMELYHDDENHYMNYVKRQLREEFSYEQIEDPKTIRRIKNIFMDVWDSKIPPQSLQNICEDLICEYPNASLTELMKIFASRYPSKKRHSRQVYVILSSITNNGG